MPSPQMAAIVADLERHKHTFDAEVVGEDVLDIAAKDAIRRFRAGVDPEENDWPDLSDAYAAWKSGHAIVDEMGHLYGAMAGDDDEFYGERAVFPGEANSTYGTGPESRDHAEWFEEGDPGRNRPARRFTEMGDIAVQLIDDFLDKHHAASL